MGLDRALADEQLGGQLGVALTVRQHRQHLALALRQGIQPRAELRPDRPACELLDDAPRDRRGEQSLAGSDDVHGGAVGLFACLFVGLFVGLLHVDLLAWLCTSTLTK